MRRRSLLGLAALLAVTVASAGWALHAYRSTGGVSPSPAGMTAAGCWSADEAHADFRAIRLVLDGYPRPSGKETLDGSMEFVVGATESYPAHGEFDPATAEIELTSATFTAKGVVTGDKLRMTMVHHDDLHQLGMTMTKDGEGCRVS